MNLRNDPILRPVVIDDLQKSHSRTAPGNRRQEGAFVPFNRQTAAWRQEKRSKRK